MISLYSVLCQFSLCSLRPSCQTCPFQKQSTSRHTASSVCSALTSLYRCPWGRRPWPGSAPTGCPFPPPPCCPAGPADAAARGRLGPYRKEQSQLWANERQPGKMWKNKEGFHILIWWMEFTNADLFLPESSHEAHCHCSELGGAGQHVESLQHHGDTELEHYSTCCVC